MKTTPWTIQDCQTHAQREADRAELARLKNPCWDTESGPHCHLCVEVDSAYDKRMQLTGQLLERYLANPLAMDDEVRSHCGLRSNRYFTVSVWPVAGIVREDDRTRVATVNKISKSNP